ncbi:hypothetical protein LCGC14_2282390 [marine sediment metagenome]|uniref:Uncharacterized protein n=1 Tax=marine sediment metagenome TaxID=412755 RepID=A0A0F9CTM9_9ZZZZ
MKTKCPYCNYEADLHETLDEQTNPEEGEISFCINCGEVSEYTEDGLKKADVFSFNKETQQEIKDIETAWLRTRNLR